MSDQTIAGAILAGGQARRFGGHDKSRVLVANGPLIVRQCAVLRQVAGTTFIVTTAADRAARPSRFDDLGLAVAVDVVDDAGALGGIHGALHAAARLAPASRRVLVVACDLPFLDAATLQSLADAARDADGAWIVGPRGPEPLIACYSLTCLDRITDALAGGERRAQALGTLLTLTAVPGSAHLTTNINTPEDLRRVQ